MVAEGFHQLERLGVIHGVTPIIRVGDNSIATIISRG